MSGSVFRLWTKPRAGSKEGSGHFNLNGLKWPDVLIASITFTLYLAVVMEVCFFEGRSCVKNWLLMTPLFNAVILEIAF